MKVFTRLTFALLSILTGIILCSSFSEKNESKVKFPYRQAGLSERQAASHLLNRFTYGARPEDIDAVVKMGLEKWFLQQLKADQSEDILAEKLKDYDALNFSNTEVTKIFPRGGQALRMAIRDGAIHKDSVAKAANRQMYRQQVQAYMREKGLRPQQELYRQFISQKILRAAYSNNQMQEVLTDFWFNHFNVSLDKGQCAEFIPAYERDVIRPNVLGKFSTLLLATAKSPAMLRYLDNFSSAGPMETSLKPGVAGTAKTPGGPALKKLQSARKNRGLNENYAREVMELHTLGVDGGYSQQDVTQAARILTGWTIYPMNDGYADGMMNYLKKAREDKLKEKGFVHEGDFLFAPSRHDMGEKVVLGRRFPANRGYEEGVELLNMLADHPSTASFISKKLAVRFVSDNPPPSLVSKMAHTFKQKKGDIREVLLTMVSAPEFWSAQALREKTKSPFDLAISAVRALKADIRAPYQLYTWINKMGQKVYYYQAPTGFPDRASYWINTGSLLNRMNFGLAIASGRIPGVRVDLAALNSKREPESAEAALHTYGTLILPERDLDATIKRLTPMLNDPHLSRKVEEAASKNMPPQTMENTMNEDARISEEDAEANVKPARRQDAQTSRYTRQESNAMLAQVVGIIIGSPEFQRK